eukprot:gb/GECH01013633.1/.p1 GENE.gb/GECH01013633.1/~~gb/GECH01013633.1/.p1  ORF type:complete len:821 (+),score=178.25 gb/GECH01013633.1/:1-2463(+)
MTFPKMKQHNTTPYVFSIIVLFILFSVFGTLGKITHESPDYKSNNNYPREIAASTISHPDFAPESFTLLGRTEPQELVELIIAVKQRNLDQLDNKFWSVSDPYSPEYGNFMSLDQITQLIQPSEASLSSVYDWLESYGIKSEHVELTASKDFISVNVPISTAEKLLDTQVYSFQHKSGTTVSRAVGSITVPQHVKHHIDFVAGLSRFPDIDRHQRRINSYHKHIESMQSGMNMLAMEETFDTSSATSSNKPSIVSALPGNNQLGLVLAPLCFNGSKPSSSKLQCDGNPIRTFRIKFSPKQHSSLTRDISVSDVECKPNPANNNNINCALSVDANLNFIATNLSISTLYQDSHQSDETKPPVPIFLGPWTTPQGIGSYYGSRERHGSNSETMQAVAEFLEQYYSPEDLKQFFDQNGLSRKTVEKVKGPNNVTMPGGEATLDIEYIMAVGINITTWFWSVASPSTNVREPYMTWIKEINQKHDNEIPQVHSVSYGDDEGAWSEDETKRINDEFKKAGTRGVSIIFSSGDDGVGNVAVRVNGTQECKPFRPSFPASSPYVTTVGATQFSTFATPQCAGTSNLNLRYDCNQVKEIACSSDTGGVITSGGGFSTIFQQPDYQKSAVSTFISRAKDLGNLPSTKLFKQKGRAYPDVSIMGHNFLVVLKGETIPIHGTSASAPTFAGMISLLNDRRFNQGKNALGFLNPLLYKIAENHNDAFYDVTMGNNRCAASHFPDKGNCCPEGFEAIPGWDPVTGLGSPKFERLSELIIEQNESNTVSKSLFWGVSGTLIAVIVCVLAALVAMFVYFRKHLGRHGESGFLINQ